VTAFLITALTRAALFRWNVKVEQPVLVYPSLATLLTFLLWLIFFY
jgi:hypothetical protein